MSTESASQISGVGTHELMVQTVPYGRAEIDGDTLAKVMAQSRDAALPVPLPVALEIVIQLCDALEHAHGNQQLVHGDVSPSNVILSSDGNVNLTDFGIAKARSSQRARIDNDKLGYQAPEYSRGQIDHRADLWGVGVIAYELLTGHRLFAGDAILENVRTMQIPRPSYLRAGISVALEEIVLNVLERNPDERIQSAGALRAALASELQRLGRVATSREIRDWMDWLFAQEPRAAIDHSVAIPIDHTETFLLDFTSTFLLEPATRSAASQTAPGNRSSQSAVSALPNEAPSTRAARTSLAAPPRLGWTPPTHWTHAPAKRSKLPFVLGGVIVAMVVTALQLGWFG